MTHDTLYEILNFHATNRNHAVDLLAGHFEDGEANPEFEYWFHELEVALDEEPLKYSLFNITN